MTIDMTCAQSIAEFAMDLETQIEDVVLHNIPPTLYDMIRFCGKRLHERPAIALQASAENWELRRIYEEVRK